MRRTALVMLVMALVPLRADATGPQMGSPTAGAACRSAPPPSASCTPAATIEEDGSATLRVTLEGPAAGLAPGNRSAFARATYWATDPVTEPVESITYTATVAVERAVVFREPPLALDILALGSGAADIWVSLFVHHIQCVCSYWRVEPVVSSSDGPVVVEDGTVTVTTTLTAPEGRMLEPGTMYLTITLYGNASVSQSNGITGLEAAMGLVGVVRSPV